MKFFIQLGVFSLNLSINLYFMDKNVHKLYKPNFFLYNKHRFMKNYCLILTYKPTFTKEQVEEKINKEINEIFKSYGIKKINYQYCGNKLFSYIIKKFKSGHYFTISFEAGEMESRNITAIQKRIKENQDVLRAITISNPFENNIAIISKLDSNINQKDLVI
jgi:ribosomal protein S6